MKVWLIFLAMLVGSQGFCQSITNKLQSALSKLKADSQLQHGLTGLYVINAKTGEIIIAENAETGMAPASCLKVITSATAFELLGHDFTYKTTMAVAGQKVNGNLDGNIIITGSGDPTLGSWRFNSTKEDTVIYAFGKVLQEAGVTSVNGSLIINNTMWDSEIIPGGWTWDDIGSYYGAGAGAFNWRENQYDILLRSGRNIGDPVVVVETIPAKIERLNLNVKVTSAEKGSGDNAYVFIPDGNDTTYIRGTIPVNENRFSISGSLPYPSGQFQQMLNKTILFKNSTIDSQKLLSPAQTIYTYNSPVFDSINFYFLRRSVNLYGEALLKTMAYKETGVGATDSGVSVVKQFWKDKGIESTAINIIDGSGLSPANRVTPKALVTVMQYATTKPWYNSFYHSLPEINNIKMKSGSIGGVASYTGYAKSKSGTDYTFAIIVNNYNGSVNAIRKKMFALLDLLK